jgi:hypothetical protein
MSAYVWARPRRGSGELKAGGISSIVPGTGRSEVTHGARNVPKLLVVSELFGCLPVVRVGWCVAPILLVVLDFLG